MLILVTGATGFIGRHVVSSLLQRGHEVVAVYRDPVRAAQMPWFQHVRLLQGDIHDPGFEPLSDIATPELVMHLAWSGIPDYENPSHVEQTLPRDCRFLRGLAERGVNRILVSGTCAEYGNKDGMLAEHMPADPTIPYAIAKDALRRYLQTLQRRWRFNLQWVRIFYVSGPGQHSANLLVRLDQAIDEKEPVFDLPEEDQLRDYLPVAEVARRLSVLAEHPECTGIVNCANGVPVSVRRMAEARIAERAADISLGPRRRTDGAFEPAGFWGCSRKFLNIDTKLE